MRTRKEFKRDAKKALLGRYDTAAGLCFMKGLILGLSMFAMLLLYLLGTVIGIGFAGNGVPIAVNGITSALSIGLLVIYMVLVMAFACLLEAGYLRLCFCLCNGQKAGMKELFFYLTHYPLRCVVIAFLQLLVVTVAMLPGGVLMVAGSVMMEGSSVGICLVMLGILVMAVPSMMWELHYSMAGFIYVENPETPALSCMRASKEMMRGHRWQLFVLFLSFLGYDIIDNMTMHFAAFWITPYKQCTVTYFYQERKKECWQGTSTGYGEIAAREDWLEYNRQQ